MVVAVVALFVAVFGVLSSAEIVVVSVAGESAAAELFGKPVSDAGLRRLSCPVPRLAQAAASIARFCGGTFGVGTGWRRK